MTYKKILFSLCLLLPCELFAQKYEMNKVESMAYSMEKWVSTDAYEDRLELEQFFDNKSFRISDDLIMQLAQKYDNTGIKSYELADFLNWLEKEMNKQPRNFKIRISNITYISPDKFEDKDNKKARGFQFYSCDITTSGSFVCSSKDMIVVRNDAVINIQPYVETTNHKIKIDFDDFINSYESVGVTYNYGQYFPIGASFNYSFEDIPFMLSVDVGVNLDKDKYVTDRIMMKDLLNFTRVKTEYDPLFYMTLTPQAYFKYFAVGCGVGMLYMKGDRETIISKDNKYEMGTVSVTSRDFSTLSEEKDKYKPMIRPVIKGFIPVSDDWYISVSAGYDYVFGYKEKNGFNFGLGLQWTY